MIPAFSFFPILGSSLSKCPTDPMRSVLSFNRDQRMTPRINPRPNARDVSRRRKVFIGVDMVPFTLSALGFYIYSVLIGSI